MSRDHLLGEILAFGSADNLDGIDPAIEERYCDMVARTLIDAVTFPLVKKEIEARCRSIHIDTLQLVLHELHDDFLAGHLIEAVVIERVGAGDGHRIAPHIRGADALLIPFYYSLRKHLAPLPILDLLWRPVVASAGMAAALYLLLPRINFFGALSLASLIYGAALLFLGALGPDEWLIARKLVPARLGRVVDFLARSPG